MINYLIGDATEPQGESIKFIIHCCNSIGGWGAGFTGALSKKWNEPERLYRFWANDINVDIEPKFNLGNVQYVQVENDIFVVNMIAQEGIGFKNGIPPVRYDALKECLLKVNKEAIVRNATIHCPRICAYLAGGDWTVIEQIIKDTMSVEVFIYDLPKY